MLKSADLRIELGPALDLQALAKSTGPDQFKFDPLGRRAQHHDAVEYQTKKLLPILVRGGGLLQARLYTREAVVRLVDAVNMRLRARQPGVATERERVRAELYQVQQRFDSVRRFIEQGEGSAKVRGWLTELERDEARLQGTLRTLEAEADRPPLRVHPGKVVAYLADLHTTLLKGGTRVREVVQQDVERIVIHPVRPNAAMPFARAEVIASGKGLLGGVTFMVAGAGFEPATFGL